MPELILEYPADTIKMIRETLCFAQSVVNRAYYIYPAELKIHSDRLQRMIAECDRQRPLASDGKHGKLHTHTCGCEDK